MPLSSEYMQHQIDYEILLDCYDEYEIAMAWQTYFEDNLEFPFTAMAWLRKRGGFEETKSVTVVGIPDNGMRYLNHDFNVEIDNEGYIVQIPFDSLSNIQASAQTMEIFEIWAYWTA